MLMRRVRWAGRESFAKLLACDALRADGHTRTLIHALLVTADCRRPCQGEPITGRSDRGRELARHAQQLDQGSGGFDLSRDFRPAI
jgi:hypothetical protein